jgi:hypothetical protein
MKALDPEAAEQAVKQAGGRMRALAASLPGNRAYFDALREASTSSSMTPNMLKQNMKG